MFFAIYKLIIPLIFASIILPTILLFPCLTLKSRQKLPTPKLYLASNAAEHSHLSIFLQDFNTIDL